MGDRIRGGIVSYLAEGAACNVREYSADIDGDGKGDIITRKSMATDSEFSYEIELSSFTPPKSDLVHIFGHSFRNTSSGPERTPSFIQFNMREAKRIITPGGLVIVPEDFTNSTLFYVCDGKLEILEIGACHMYLDIEDLQSQHVVMCNIDGIDYSLEEIDEKFVSE